MLAMVRLCWPLNESHSSTSWGVNNSLNQPAALTEKDTFCWEVKGKHRHTEVSQRPKKFGSQRHWGSSSFFHIQGHVLKLHGQTVLDKASSSVGKREEKHCRYKTAFRCSSNCCPDSVSISLHVLFHNPDKVSEYSSFKYMLHLIWSDCFSGVSRLYNLQGLTFSKSSGFLS